MSLWDVAANYVAQHVMRTKRVWLLGRTVHTTRPVDMARDSAIMNIGQWKTKVCRMRLQLVEPWWSHAPITCVTRHSIYPIDVTWSRDSERSWHRAARRPRRSRRRQYYVGAADLCWSARHRRWFVGAPPKPLLLLSYFFAINFRWLKKVIRKFWEKNVTFQEFLKNSFFDRPRLAAADFFGPAARRRRPKLTGAPPPTQWRRRTALSWYQLADPDIRQAGAI